MYVIFFFKNVPYFILAEVALLRDIENIFISSDNALAKNVLILFLSEIALLKQFFFTTLLKLCSLLYLQW